jgi:3-hydroxyacyl-[acyl-carrier-protein] dehydratase
MHLEYFQLIDRILDLNIGEKTITVEAQVPQHNTIFEGHFPGYPIMPGVLLIESMAQASGWLLLGLMKFERMPFLAAVKEAKMRGFVTPGELLTIEANVLHEGSGYAMTEAKVRVGGKLKCNAAITFSHIPFPNPDLRGHMDAVARRIGFPQARARRKYGSPVSVLPRRLARVWMLTGTRSINGGSMSMRRASRPTSCIPGRR